MHPLIVGTLAIDELEFPHGRVENSFGGSASFSSVAASFFGPVRLVSTVGADFPPAFRDLLTARGIDLGGVITIEGDTTFRWHGRYHEDLNCRETVELNLGVLATSEPVVPPAYADSRPVLIANMPPAKQLHVLSQLPRPRFVLADTIDDWIIAHRDELIAMLGQVDAILMNDSEARLLARDSNLIRAGRLIQSLGPPIVILKKGEHGCVLFDAAGVTVLPAYPTENVVDPTGAGDSFAGGLLGYLGSQAEITPTSLRRAICYGTVVASLTVEGYGLDRLKATSRAEIDERLASYRKMLSLD